MIRFADGTPVPTDYLDRLTALVNAACDNDPGEDDEPTSRIACPTCSGTGGSFGAICHACLGRAEITIIYRLIPHMDGTIQTYCLYWQDPGFGRRYLGSIRPTKTGGWGDGTRWHNHPTPDVAAVAIISAVIANDGNDPADTCFWPNA